MVTSRELCHHFQAHPIIIMIDQLIRKTMNKIDVAGHLVQWAIELGQFDTEYRPRVVVKAQVLVDFSTEFTYPQEEEQPQKKKWMV